MDPKIHNESLGCFYLIFQLNAVVIINLLIRNMIINNESTLGHSFNQALKAKYIIVSNEVYSILIGMAPSFHFSITGLTRQERERK